MKLYDLSPIVRNMLGTGRLASGELTAVYPDVSARQPAVQRDRFFERGTG